MRSDTRQDVVEPGLRIHVVHLVRRHDRENNNAPGGSYTQLRPVLI
jgi:hypothetical protein